MPDNKPVQGRDFLLEEYKASWKMILAIDERRGKFVQYYSAVVIAVLAFCANLLKDKNLFDKACPLDSSTVRIINCLALLTIVAGFAVIWMLIAERCANIRYRKKVNLIRELILEGTDFSGDKYLGNEAYEDLGVKKFSGKPCIQPKCIGKTLKGVFAFILIEMVFLLATLWSFGIVYDRCLWALLVVGLLAAVFLWFCRKEIKKAEKAGYSCD